MLIEYFKQYMKVTRGITDKSVGHYITGINSINALLVKYDFPVKNIFSVASSAELDAVKAFLETNEEFLEKDSTGHHMYGVAFKHFYRFACVDNEFFQKSITQQEHNKRCTNCLAYIHIETGYKCCDHRRPGDFG